jgi:hypothetical protein
MWVRRAGGTVIEFIPIDISDVILRTEAAPNLLDTASEPLTCRCPAEPTPCPRPRPTTARDAFASRPQRPGPKAAVRSTPKISADCEEQHARAPTRYLWLRVTWSVRSSFLDCDGVGAGIGRRAPLSVPSAGPSSYLSRSRRWIRAQCEAM